MRHSFANAICIYVSSPTVSRKLEQRSPDSWSWLFLLRASPIAIQCSQRWDGGRQQWSIVSHFCGQEVWVMKMMWRFHGSTVPNLTHFQKEANIPKLLAPHPNIISILHSWSEYIAGIQERRWSFSALEPNIVFCDATDELWFVSISATGRRMVFFYTCRLVSDVCGSIVCSGPIGRKKIAHRNIKPANIFVDHTGTLVLGNFGAADRICYAEDKPITVGINFAWCGGSPSYQAPEVLDRCASLPDWRGRNCLAKATRGKWGWYWNTWCYAHPSHGARETKLFVARHHANLNFWTADCGALCKDYWNAIPPRGCPAPKLGTLHFLIQIRFVCCFYCFCHWFIFLAFYFLRVLCDSYRLSMFHPIFSPFVFLSSQHELLHKLKKGKSKTGCSPCVIYWLCGSRALYAVSRILQHLLLVFVQYYSPRSHKKNFVNQWTE